MSGGVVNRSIGGYPRPTFDLILNQRYQGTPDYCSVGRGESMHTEAHHTNDYQPRGL